MLLYCCYCGESYKDTRMTCLNPKCIHGHDFSTSGGTETRVEHAERQTQQQILEYRIDRVMELVNFPERLNYDWELIVKKVRTLLEDV